MLVRHTHEKIEKRLYISDPSHQKFCMQCTGNWSHFLLLQRCHISTYPESGRIKKGGDYVDRFMHPPWKRDETSDTLEASHNNFAWNSLAKGAWNEANVQWRLTYASWSSNNNTEYNKAKQGGRGKVNGRKGAVWVVWTLWERAKCSQKCSNQSLFCCLYLDHWS